MSPDQQGTPLSRLPLIGRGAVDRMVRERTWMLEQRIEVLERERQDLGRILRGLGEGVLAVDNAGIVVHANPAATALLDMDRAAAIGSHMFIAVPHPAACDLIEDVMRGQSRQVRELVVDDLAGNERVLVLAGRPLRKGGVDEGEPEGAIVVVRDVTDLRRLERARQDFFGNVSHELKTPVTAIRGAIETIIDDPAMADDVQARFLDGARRHAIRLSALVTDLLALARLEGDPRELRREDVDLGALAAEVVDAAASVAERSGVALHLELAGPDGAAVVHADEEAVRQALSNLVDNAVAHSSEGGSVRIRVGANGAEATVTVADEGTGIPADAIERVFERFYRVDAARSRARGGTGIGLSIVKHVAQSHGGRVAVASELDRGSTFTLVLPVSSSAGRGTQPGG